MAPYLLMFKLSRHLGDIWNYVRTREPLPRNFHGAKDHSVTEDGEENPSAAGRWRKGRDPAGFSQLAPALGLQKSGTPSNHWKWLCEHVRHVVWNPRDFDLLPSLDRCVCRQLRASHPKAQRMI